MIEEVFKHSAFYLELFLSRFFEFCPHVLPNYLLTGFSIISVVNNSFHAL